MNNTQPVCVFVALIIQNAMRMRKIVIRGLTHSTIFFPRCLINGRILGKTLLNTKYVLILSAAFVRNICHSKKKLTRDDKKCILVFM
jgi:hypothetical protein